MSRLNKIFEQFKLLKTICCNQNCPYGRLWNKSWKFVSPYISCLWKVGEKKGTLFFPVLASELNYGLSCKKLLSFVHYGCKLARISFLPFWLKIFLSKDENSYWPKSKFIVTSKCNFILGKEIIMKILFFWVVIITN